jgi:hypothetical protein
MKERSRELGRSTITHRHIELQQPSLQSSTDTFCPKRQQKSSIYGHVRVDVLLGCVVELRMDWAGVSTDGASCVARGATCGWHAMVTFVCSFFK